MSPLDALHPLLQAHELVAHQASIEASSRPSLRLKLSDPNSDPFATRIGGLPVLKDGARWPCGKNLAPLGFLAQINLQELPINPYGLPTNGMLAFFYDIDNQPWGFHKDAGDWCIVFTEIDSALRLREAPEGSNQPVLPPRGVRLLQEVTVPAPRSIELEALTISTVVMSGIRTLNSAGI